jgi:2-alkyl-3-oxoalkanoate reductase
MKALVTGGGGFLGKAVVQHLKARGDVVRSFSRSRYPELESLGVECFQGDLADFAAVSKAIEGCDVVFHTAALPGIWGAYSEFYKTNVVGTENVIAGCLKYGVKRLVYTSSPSVVSNGQDLEGVDESVPYGESFEAHYPRTKAMAEKKVREANSQALGTVCLRPHLIWGPGDHHIIPRLVNRSKAGRLRRIGRANKLVDTIYIDNAAEAHLLAADKLEPGSEIAGKVYFLSQGEPVPCWDMINHFLEAAGAPLVTRSVPFLVAYVASCMMELVYGLFRVKKEPPLTRFVVHQFSTAHWFDISAARSDLGYEPRIDNKEGLKRLRDSLQAQS